MVKVVKIILFLGLLSLFSLSIYAKEELLVFLDGQEDRYEKFSSHQGCIIENPYKLIDLYKELIWNGDEIADRLVGKKVDLKDFEKQLVICIIGKMSTDEYGMKLVKTSFTGETLKIFVQMTKEGVKIKGRNPLYLYKTNFSEDLFSKLKEVVFYEETEVGNTIFSAWKKEIGGFKQVFPPN